MIEVIRSPRPFDFSRNRSSIEFQCSGPGVVDPNYGVNVRITCQDADHSAEEEIFNERIPLLNKISNRIEVPLSGRIHDYITANIRELNPDIPEGNFAECKKSCREYSVYYAEVVSGVPGTEESITGLVALHGGLSNRAQLTSTLEAILQPGGTAATDRFLKQGPRSVYTRPEQLQYLYFFNTREAASDAKLNIRYVFTDETTSDIVLKTFDLEALHKYAFNVTFESFYTPYEGKTVDHYHVWISSSSGAALSETRTYHIDRSLKKHVRYFLNWSSFGSFDSRVCFGEGSTEFQITQSEAELMIKEQQSIMRGSAIAFDLRSQSHFTASTGFMPAAELMLWRDFYLSAMKYRLANGILMPIAITSSRLAEVNDASKLLAHNIEYRYLYEEHAYTEGDIEDGGRYYKNILFYNQVAPDGAFASENGNLLLSEQQYFITD